jgi:hypothetical protein
MENLTVLLKDSPVKAEIKSEISKSLDIFFSQANEWNETIKSIVITDPSEIGKMKMAREGRLTLKGQRLQALDIIKEKRSIVKNRMADDQLEDALLLSAGKMIEATFKNLESKLEEKEKFAERWEKEQKQKLRIERLDQLSMVSDNVEIYPVENMSQVEFDQLFYGLEIAKKNKILADEQEAELQRKIKKAEETEKQRLREALEREKLKNETLIRQSESKSELWKIGQQTFDESKSIKDNLISWVDSLVITKPKQENKTVSDILEKFEMFKSWAKDQINENIK